MAFLNPLTADDCLKYESWNGARLQWL